MQPADDHSVAARRSNDPGAADSERPLPNAGQEGLGPRENRSRHLAEVAEVIRRLEGRLGDAGRANTLSRWLLTAGSVALLGLMATFGLSLWKGLQQRITEEKLQAALMAKVDSIWPRLSEKLTAQVMEVVPEYGTLAVQRGEKVWPELSTKLAAEAGDFADALERDVRTRSEQAVKRVSTKLAADLKTDFPSLDEKRIDALAAKIQTGMIGEGGVLAEELQVLLGREQERITAMFAKLPVEKTAALPEERLQKDFIHHVLMLVDTMVLEEPGAATTTALRPSTPVTSHDAPPTVEVEAGATRADEPAPSDSAVPPTLPSGATADVVPTSEPAPIGVPE